MKFFRGMGFVSAAAMGGETFEVHPEISCHRWSGLRRNSSGLLRKVQSADEMAIIGTEIIAARNQFFIDAKDKTVPAGPRENKFFEQLLSWDVLRKGYGKAIRIQKHGKPYVFTFTLS